MTVCNLIDQHNPSRAVLSSVNQLYIAIRNLQRLSGTYIEFCTNSVGRQSFYYIQMVKVKHIRKLWEDTLIQAQNSHSTSVSVEDSCNQLQARLENFHVIDLYKKKLQKIKSVEDLVKYARRFMQDLDALVAPPLRQSKRGMKGPTLLVSHTRERHVQAYVIKWIDPHETICNHIYAEMSYCMDEDMASGRHGHGFQVPLVVELDFTEDQARHFSYDGTVKKLSPNHSKKLFDAFQQITKNFAPERPPQYNKIMLSEMINGANLFDFARKQYVLLSEDQKRKMFNRLGRLAFLDMILGNLDRLVQVMLVIQPDGSKEYELMDLETNLGNVMLLQTKEDHTLVSIDNGIEEDLIFNMECRAKYLSFLQRTLLSEDYLQKLAQNIIDSMLKAINTQIDDYSEANVLELREQFEDLKSDLETISLEEFKKGIYAMVCHLQVERFKPENLFVSLENKHPSLIASLRERIKFFQNLKIGVIYE